MYGSVSHVQTSLGRRRPTSSPGHALIAVLLPRPKRMVAVFRHEPWTWTAVEWPSGCWPSCWPSARWSRWASITMACRPVSASEAVVVWTTGHSQPRYCRLLSGHSGPRTIRQPTMSLRPDTGSGRALLCNTGPRRWRPPWTETHVQSWDWPTLPLTLWQSSRDLSSR